MTSTLITELDTLANGIGYERKDTEEIVSELIEQVARNHQRHLDHCVSTIRWEAQCGCASARMIAALRELSAKLDTRWEDWRKQLLDAWAKDHRATMTALLEGGPAAPPRKAEETTNEAKSQ